MIETELAIVGAGPAGLAAAAEAARRGVTVAVLDDNPTPGGQYLRQPPAALARARGRGAHRGAELLSVVDDPRVAWLSGAVVWHAPGPGVLAYARGAESGRIRARATLIAAGAVERAVPFPGWTLPGVLTAGGLQNLVKGQRVLPGRRFLVAGNGPLLLVAAQSILEAGGAVVEVVESAPLAGAWRRLPRLLGAPDVLRRGLGYRAALLRARVPFRTGETIVSCSAGAPDRGLPATAGDDSGVREAVVAPIDAGGRVDRARARRLAVDTVAVGFGLVPSVELTRLLGCRHRWDARRGGLVPERTDDLETTVPGVFVAGDGGGIGGAELAMAQGRLAGLVAAQRLGRGGAPEIEDALRAARARVRRLDRVRAAIAELWAGPTSYTALLTPDTVVCRCEEATAADVARLIDDGAPSLEPIKAATRVTMGRCQGRNCLATVSELAARALEIPVAELVPPRARPPARPVRLADLLHEPLPPPRPPELGLR